MDRVPPATYRLQSGGDELTKNGQEAREHVAPRRIARTQFQNGTHAASYSSLPGLATDAGGSTAGAAR